METGTNIGAIIMLSTLLIIAVGSFIYLQMTELKNHKPAL